MDNPKLSVEPFHVPKPKFLIDDSVVFHYQEGERAVLGSIGGARYDNGEWVYTVHTTTYADEPTIFSIPEEHLTPAA